jgi:uncharacterized protein with HEPN domain
MPKREDKLLLIDILQSGDKIAVYTKNISFVAFAENDMMIDAVVRNLEIIGEASKLVSGFTKELSAFIEWKRMAQFRDVLIHDYFGVELEIVWDVIQNHLPRNIELIKKLLDTNIK